MRPAALNMLFADIKSLPGIGPRMAPLYDKLLGNGSNGARVIDLLFHLPHGTVDRRIKGPLIEAVPGTIGTFKVQVTQHFHGPPGRSKAPYRVHVEDETGDLLLVFFNAVHQRLVTQLPIGEWRIISGTVELFDGHRQMTHPDRVLDDASYQRLPPFEPVYGLTAGLYPSGLVKATSAALERLPELSEWIDPDLLTQRAWPSFPTALRNVHRPRIAEGDHRPRHRLAYDELLAGQLALLLMRAHRKREQGEARSSTGELAKRLEAALPFTLTQGQRDALDDITRDLEAPERMLRLVQGDVGSGKTVVALLAMARVVEAGWQSALMAPTEILARQHFERLKPLADKAGISIALLTGRDKGAARTATLKGLADGSIHIVIGTHALFQEAVTFHKLGLAVIDEQHRFGVHQRLALSQKGDAVDVLVMTATPIPRTLVLTYFGDMDVSLIREKPAGRTPIDTRILPLDRLEEVATGLQRALKDGKRIYWICPLVSESEESDLAAAEARFADLQKLYGNKVGLVHGKMKGAEKDAAMEDFARGVTSVLVATTVVEVGVDVPEASIMIIEHAERFGLAQLHQLRGRVGRGAEKSSCLLLYGALGETGRARLEIMRSTEDGFLIAEEDLKLRGEGDVLGTRQSGMPGFRLTVPDHHAELLSIARSDAKNLLNQDPQLESPRGLAARALLYLFERDEAIRLIRAG
jgi:ATP-dependent DNA helicase RecG